MCLLGVLCFVCDLTCDVAWFVFVCVVFVIHGGMLYGVCVCVVVDCVCCWCCLMKLCVCS